MKKMFFMLSVLVSCALFGAEGKKDIDDDASKKRNTMAAINTMAAVKGMADEGHSSYQAVMRDLERSLHDPNYKVEDEDSIRILRFFCFVSDGHITTSARETYKTVKDNHIVWKPEVVEIDKTPKSYNGSDDGGYCE